MAQFSSKYSICATCANWGGARKAVGQRRNYKLVKVLEQQGECYEQILRKGATATCNRFELWGVLKR